MFELLASANIILGTLGTLGGVWTLLARIPVVDEILNRAFFCASGPGGCAVP